MATDTVAAVARVGRATIAKRGGGSKVLIFLTVPWALC